MEGLALAVLAAFCWGSSGVVYKKGLKGVSEFYGNMLRSIVASLFFFPILVFRDYISELLKIDLFTASILVISAILSFFIGDLLYLYSLKRAPVSIVLPLSATYPIYVVLLSQVIYSVKFNLNLLMASLLTVLAVYAISKSAKGSDEVKSLRGIYFALIAAFFWALAILTIDYLTTKLSVITIAGVRIAFNAAILILIVSSLEGFKIDSNAVKYLGIAGGLLTFVGIYSFIEAVHLAGSWKVTPITASSPVIGALLGKISLKEKIDLNTAVSIILVVFSVVIVSITY